jgi:hypothetical protein
MNRTRGKERSPTSFLYLQATGRKSEIFKSRGAHTAPWQSTKQSFSDPCPSLMLSKVNHTVIPRTSRLESFYRWIFPFKSRGGSFTFSSRTTCLASHDPSAHIDSGCFPTNQTRGDPTSCASGSYALASLVCRDWKPGHRLGTLHTVGYKDT